MKNFIYIGLFIITCIFSTSRIPKYANHRSSTKVYLDNLGLMKGQNFVLDTTLSQLFYLRNQYIHKYDMERKLIDSTALDLPDSLLSNCQIFYSRNNCVSIGCLNDKNIQVLTYDSDLNSIGMENYSIPQGMIIEPLYFNSLKFIFKIGPDSAIFYPKFNTNFYLFYEQMLQSKDLTQFVPDMYTGKYYFLKPMSRVKGHGTTYELSDKNGLYLNLDSVVGTNLLYEPSLYMNDSKLYFPALGKCYDLSTSKCTADSSFFAPTIHWSKGYYFYQYDSNILNIQFGTFNK